MEKVLAFDCGQWAKTLDINDNLIYWKPALIINERKDDLGRELVDVQFEDGRISHGHFKEGVIKLHEPPVAYAIH